MKKIIRKRKIKALKTIAMPLKENFDLHEDVKTNEQYLNALSFRLRKFPENVYTISYSQMYQDNDPWEMEKEQEFVSLIKEFFDGLPDEQFIDDINPNLSSGKKSLEDFIAFTKEKNFSFNGKFLHEEITDPKNSTLIIRNSPSESLPKQGTDFKINSFYFLHDVLCHSLMEQEKNLLKVIMDSLVSLTIECMKNYVDEHGNKLIEKKKEVIQDYKRLNSDDDHGHTFKQDLLEYYGAGRYLMNKETRRYEFKDDLYSEEGYVIFNRPFVKNLINFKRHSGDDDVFCDFIASLFSVDPKLLMQKKPFEFYGVEYKPNDHVDLIFGNFVEKIKSVINSNIFKKLYKNKVIYHPFYLD